MTTKELAERVLAMMDVQAAYFKAKANADMTTWRPLLEQAKQLERDMRKTCEEIVNPAPSEAPSLFNSL